MDKYIRVKNCNCISDATIEIVEKSLNIKYGSNGTGKSTISEAIYAQANNETDRLKDFKPYGSNDNSQPTVDNPYFHVVKVFNEDYVNSYLFQGDEFLDDSFQVFLKSDKCDSLAAQIERMLEELQDLINNIDAIHNLRTFLPQYTAAVKASDGTVSRRGGVAEFVNGNGGGFNHYSELKAYKPFYSRDLPSVAKWAKWRNDGIKQMCGNDCPFCTNILPSSIRSQNEIISKVFKNSALSVANAVLEYVQQAVDQGYILPDAVDVLESYIGDNTKADELYAELQMLTMLTDILRGANSKRILDNGLEMVPEYGMLKEIPRETIQNIIEWLINEHYILKTKEKYPVLHSTYEGLHYSESLTKTKLEELKAYLEKDEA